MNKDYFVKQLMTFAEEYKIEVSEELVGDIVSLASFRVVKKGRYLLLLEMTQPMQGLSYQEWHVHIT